MNISLNNTRSVLITDWFIVLFEQIPFLFLDFLLPSDVARLASTSKYFRNAFLGKNESGASWWKHRCLSRLGLSVAAVVHPISTPTWFQAYSYLRSLFNCRIAVRFTSNTNNVEKLGMPYYMVEAEQKQNNEWVVIEDEELNEATLERFFYQSDFYRHQLTTMFAIRIYITRHLQSHPSIMHHVSRLSFVDIPESATHNTYPSTDINWPESSLQRQEQDSTELACWCSDTAVLALPSSLFPDTETHMPQWKINTILPLFTDDLTNRETSRYRESNHSREVFQTRLFLSSRKELIHFHQFIVTYVSYHPNIKQIQHAGYLITPGAIVSLCYSLLTSSDIWSLSYQTSHSSPGGIENLKQRNFYAKELHNAKVSEQMTKQIAAILKNSLSPDLWHAFFQIIEGGISQYKKKNRTPFYKSPVNPVIQASGYSVPNLDVLGAERLRSLLTAVVRRVESKNTEIGEFPKYIITKICLSVSSRDHSSEQNSSTIHDTSKMKLPDTIRCCTPIIQKRTVTTDKSYTPRDGSCFPVAYSQEVFELYLPAPSDSIPNEVIY